MSSATEVAPAEAAAPSTWSPLRSRVFRAVWIAQLGSNIGTWIQTVGAQWLLVHEPHASTLVALVQTATSLPFMLIGLPAGVLADVFDRRAYLVATQTLLLSTAAVMAGLTFAGLMHPALLLTLTFVLGCGSALAMPAWQAITPSLVERRDLPAASALGGISQNLARAVGPALAGVLVAWLGAGAVFAINAASFVGSLVVMATWREHISEESTLGRERMGAALRAGARYVRHSPVVRRLLLRLSLFVVPATALWALLPVVAKQRLGLGSSGYGLLLAALGAGAIAGALVLPRISRRAGASRLVGASGLVYAAALVVAGVVARSGAVLPALVLAGFAWLAVLVTVNATLQLFLPAWVRARGLAVYQIVFMGGQGLAALAWGVVAQSAGIPAAFVAAAVLLAVGSATTLRWPLHEIAGLNRERVSYWAEPALAIEPHSFDGPVVVAVRYSVRPENAQAFVDAMQAVGRSRRRTGAVSWDLYREGEDPEGFLELWVVPTWDEHLRQHEDRLTGTDREFEERALALVEGEPEVRHLFPPDGNIA